MKPGEKYPNEFSPLKGELKLEAEVIRLRENLDSLNRIIVNMQEITEIDQERISTLTTLGAERDKEIQELRQVVKEVESILFKHLAVYVVMEGPRPYLKNKASLPLDLHNLSVRVDALLAPKVTGDKLSKEAGQ